VITEPEASAVFSDKKSADGFVTSTSPIFVISKTPISLVEPYLFFTALTILKMLCFSPSKYSTVSTICSSTLGPAIAPLFVT
jgi:hypothetical protein